MGGPMADDQKPEQSSRVGRKWPAGEGEAGELATERHGHVKRDERVGSQSGTVDVSVF